MNNINLYNQYFNGLRLFTTYDTIYYYFLSKYIIRKATIIQKIDFLIKYLHLQKYSKILDIGCGPGIYSNILTKLGYNVVGIDKNGSLLSIAKKVMNKLNIYVKYKKMNMEDIKYLSKFDRAILIRESFAYLDTNKGMLALKNIYNALNNNGLLCMDFINKNYVLNNLPKYQIFTRNAHFLIEKYMLSSDRKALYIQCSILKSGVKIKKTFAIILYDINHICKLLDICGFEVIKIYGNSRGKPLEMNDKKVILIARKI